MPRQARKLSRTGVYHVMLRGINRQDIFEDDGDYRQMTGCLRSLTERYDEMITRTVTGDLYNLNVLNDSVISQYVGLQLFTRELTGIRLKPFDGLQNMLQANSVSKRLSHKSGFYHGQHFHERREADLSL